MEIISYGIEMSYFMEIISYGIEILLSGMEILLSGMEILPYGMEILSFYNLFWSFWYLAQILCALYLTRIILEPNNIYSTRYILKNDIGNYNFNKAYVFVWKVQNLNYCWLKKGQYIKSPTFTAEALEDTNWSFELYPKGLTTDNFVVVLLKREKDCYGSDVIHVKYQLAFLDKYGSNISDEILREGVYERESIGASSLSEKRDKIFGTLKNAVQLEDTLTVQCKIWEKDNKPIVSEFLSARTIFKVNQKSFVWRLDNFCTMPLEHLSRNNFTILNEFKKHLLNFNLVLKKGERSEKELHIDISLLADCIKYFSVKTSIKDSEGQKIECGCHEYIDGQSKKRMISTPLITKETLKTIERYLLNDILSIDCECIFSTGTVLSECTNCGTITSSVIQVTDKNEKEHFAENQNTPILVDDLKSMYSNAILCDVELCTSTKTFSAHKTILSSRSPFFRTMFSNDTKKKNSGHVDITDVDDETMQRMLTYIYTDTLGNIQMENAFKMYTVANKYDIPSLRWRCSTFLKDNMCQNTVCGVLILADMYQDRDLKAAAQEYILGHSKDIFNTPEWKMVMATNLQLAADVMYQNASQPRI